MHDYQLLIHKLFNPEIGKLAAKPERLTPPNGSSGAVSVSQLI